MLNSRPLPYVTVVLAMSADGKISDATRSPARFPSPTDQQHLQARVADADATLFGAGTLRAYGTTLSVRSPELLAQRQHQGLPAQPSQIVCSAGGQLDPGLSFFTQPVPRWLLTSTVGAVPWQAEATQSFERILPWLKTPIDGGATNWRTILQKLYEHDIHRLLVMGGGQLVAALAALDMIDELWLTICPLLIGGRTSPTPLDGPGFSLAEAPRLQLLSAEAKGDEVFLHYRRA